MANNYLNKNVKFQCPFGNAVWFSAQNGDSKVRISGSEALMDDCKLSLIGGPRPGQCNKFIDPSTGAPGACVALSISGTWNSNSRVKIGSYKMLSSAGSISCPRDGNIKPFKPTLMSINIDDGAREQVVNIKLKSNSTNADSDQDTSKEENTRAYSQSNEDVAHNDVENDSRIEKNANSKETENDIYALCDYKNCDKSGECNYLQASSMLKETNESKNAAELKINMGKDSFDIYAGDCSTIATSLYESYMYSIAHHHIIPANQCFKDFPEIVKLANYYGYNINKAENGISLPTMNIGYDKQPFDLRKNIAFNAMQKLGKQWHKGGHKYSFKISAEIDSVLSKPLLHYKDAVDKELTNLSTKYNSEMKCRSEEYDKQADEFTRIMDHICEKVAKKLRKFEEEPRKSYPYFISKIAFYYAFYDELVDYEAELFRKDDGL